MKSKKIAIIGSDGYIGSRLLKIFQTRCAEVIQIAQRQKSCIYELELKQAQNFNYSILDTCEYVIFTAAISAPDMCANQHDLSYQINVTGTKFFIQQAIKRNCKVLFFSSDAVFGNDKGEPFNEESPTEANTAYGHMKKEVEDYFKTNSLFKAIRLSYVVSPKDKFSSYILNCRKSGEVAEIYHPFYRNCNSIDDVTDSVQWLIENWNEFDKPFLNICGSELVSRIRIVDEINRISKQKIKYTVAQPPERFFVNRPKITEMRSLYLNRVLKQWDEPFSSKIMKQFKY